MNESTPSSGHPWREAVPNDLTTCRLGDGGIGLARLETSSSKGKRKLGDAPFVLPMALFLRGTP